jgi:polysaccharide biosynthesis protein PslH
VLRAVDALVPITPEDASAFSRMLKGASHAVHVLPFAMRPPTIRPGIVLPNTVFHIGAMDWAPNVEGVNWLVKEVWPRVLAKMPHATLHLAGKQLEKTDERFNGKNITVHGEVGDAFEFMGSYAVMAVPLLGGGGMRVKLVEGMALGKPIVTTTIGAEGTGVKSDRHLLIADTPGAFAEALCLLLEEPGRATALGENAKTFVASNFSLAAASEKLNDFYASLLT